MQTETTETATLLTHTYDPACPHGGEGVTVHHAPGSESWFVCPACTPLVPGRCHCGRVVPGVFEMPADVGRSGLLCGCEPEVYADAP